MAYTENINIGTTANDGQGDGLRTNLAKLIENDKEFNHRTATSKIDYDSIEKIATVLEKILENGKLTVTGGGVANSLGDWLTKSNSVFKLANPDVMLGFGYNSSDQVLLQAFTATSVPKSLCINVYGGSLGVGTDSPSEKLDVAGNIKCVTLIQTSDKKFKSNY